MLIVTNLSASVSKKAILRSFSLEVAPGTIHALMGPNGSGKSSFASVLMGHPTYHVDKGTLTFCGEDITNKGADKRAQAGMFLAFQYPYALPGVSVQTFLKEAYQAVGGPVESIEVFYKRCVELCTLLAIDPALLERSLNDGFSGGERKRFEMLQLLMLQPKLLILDEIDSGLDVDALKIVAQGIAHARQQNPNIAIVLITHYQRILDYIVPDYVHIVRGGTIVASGDNLLAHSVEQHGYEKFAQSSAQKVGVHAKK